MSNDSYQAPAEFTGIEYIKFREYLDQVKVKIFNQNEIIQHQQKPIPVKDVIDHPFYPDDAILSLFAIIVYKNELIKSLDDAFEELLQQKEINDDLRQYIGEVQEEKQWRLYALAENERDGYFGAAFWNPKFSQLVISHRGTDSKKAVLADWEGVMQLKYTSQIHSACVFATYILQGVDQGKIHVSITGHSLGGWLGQISTFVMEYLVLKNNIFTSRDDRNERDPRGVLHCLVLDSPGCYEMLCQIAADYYRKYEKSASKMISALDITIYFNEPNLVNGCHSHRDISRLLQIYDKSNNEEYRFLLSQKKWYDYFKFLKDNRNFYIMLKTHSGINFLKLLITKSKDIEIKSVLDWPSIRFRTAIDKTKIMEKPSISKAWLNIMSAIKPNLAALRAKENELLQYFDMILEFDETKEKYGGIDIRYKVLPNENFSQNLSVFTKNEKYFLKYWKRFYDEKINLEKLDNIQGLLREHELEKFENFLPKFEFQKEKHCKSICTYSAENLEITIRRVKQLHSSLPVTLKCIEKDNEKLHPYELLYENHSKMYAKNLPNLEVDFEDTIGLETFLNDTNQQLLWLTTESSTANEMFRVRNILKKKLRPGVKGQCYFGLTEFNELQKKVDVKTIYQDENCFTDSILVIECAAEKFQGNDKEFLESFIEMAKNCKSKKKIILIINDGNEWLQEMLQRNSENKEAKEIFNEKVKFHFSSFTKDTQRNLLKKKVATLRSRDVTLGQFLNISDHELLRENPYIDFLSQPHVMDLFLTNESPCNELTSPHVMEYDSLKILTIDSQKIFELNRLLKILEKNPHDLEKLFEKSIMFVLSGINREKFQETINTKNIPELNLDQVTFLEDNLEKFNALCHENNSNRIYWFHFLEENNVDKIELKKIFDPDFYIKPTLHRQDEINKTKLVEFLKKEIQGEACTFIFANCDHEKLDKALKINELAHINWINDESCKEKELFENEFSFMSASKPKRDTRNEYVNRRNEKQSSWNILRNNLQLMNPQNLSIAFTANIDEGLNLFNEINNENNSVHLINVEENCEKFSWICSGNSLQPMPNILETKSHILTIEDFFTLKGKIFLIAGKSGTGKTTLLSKIAQQSKNSWVLWVNLIEFRKKMNNLQKEINLDSVMDFLSLNNEHIKVPAIRALLKFNLEHKAGIPAAIFLDGFDEINIDLQEKIISILEFLKQKTNSVIYIASKIWAKDQIENKLHVLSTEIQDLKRRQQKKFIKYFWIDVFSINEENGDYQQAFESAADKLFDGCQIISFQRTLSPSDQSFVQGYWDKLDEFLNVEKSDIFLCSKILDDITIKIKLFYDHIKSQPDYLKKNQMEAFVDFYRPEDLNYNNKEIKFFQLIFANFLKLVRVLDEKKIFYSKNYLKNKYFSFQNEKPLQELTKKYIKFLKVIQEWNPKVKGKSAKSADFLAIPLQLRMVGEILQQKIDLNTLQQISKDLSSNIFQLYSQFTNKKLEMYVKEKLKKKSPIRKLTENALLEKHCCLAFQIIFPNDYKDILEDKEILNPNDDEWQEAIESINGIGIAIISKSDDIEFSHTSFSEYFAAEKIFQIMSRKHSNHTNLENLVMSNILLKEENEMIRRFLDGRLEINLTDGKRLEFFKCLEKAYIQATENTSLINQPFPHTQIKNTETPSLFEKISNNDRETALHICANENLQYLSESILSGFNQENLQKYLDECNVNCETALYYTMTDNNLQFCTKLREKGTKKNLIRLSIQEIEKEELQVDDEVKDGATTIYVAYSKKKFKLLLVTRNEDPKIIDNTKTINIFKLVKLEDNIDKLCDLSSASLFTLLDLAIEEESSNDIDFLIQRLPQPHPGYSEILHSAVKKGNMNVVMELLKTGVNIDTIDPNNNLTPVNSAACEGHWEIVMELINRGANVAIPTSKYKQTVLHFAAWKGAKKEVVLKTLEARGDINAIETSNNFTPVNAAACAGRWEIVLELIKGGADVTIPTSKYNQTVLYFAASHGEKEVVLKTLEARGDINAIETSYNLTPINAAALNGHWDIVHKLILKKAKLDFPEKIFQNTVLHFAAEQGKLNIVKELLDHKAKIDPLNMKSQTPFFLAALNNHWDIVVELLNRSADIFSGDRKLIILELAKIAGRLNDIIILLNKK